MQRVIGSESMLLRFITLICYDNILIDIPGVNKYLNINRNGSAYHTARITRRDIFTDINILRLQIASERTDLLLYGREPRTDIFYVNIRMQRANQSM